ncbi:MAG: glycosyltransferase [Flavobacteriales bacterium]
MKIAILLPRKSLLTETFIQAQIDHLKGSKYVFHGGQIPTHLDEFPLSTLTNKFTRLWQKVRYTLGVETFTHQEFLFRRALKKLNPNVILVQYGDLAARNLNVIRSLQIPMVVHFHGYDASMYNVLSSLEKEYKEMFHYSKAIIVVSKKMESMILELGAPPEKIHRVCYGPNTEYATVQPIASSKSFLTIGRFVDKKAPHLTILAFRKILAQHPDAQLRMIGNGPLWGFCNDLVKHLQLQENVHLLGAHGLDVILEEIGRSCGFVQHSRRAESGDMEGTPNAVLEALLASVPVVSTYHAGIPDIVENGVNGLLSAENDVDAMSENLSFILDHSKEAAEMGRRGRAKIIEEYSQEKYINAIQSILEMH